MRVFLYTAIILIIVASAFAGSYNRGKRPGGRPDRRSGRGHGRRSGGGRRPPSVNPNPNYKFPSDFSWGCGTDAYGIEGAWNEDGKAPSVFDNATHTPGVFEDSSTGDFAADSYHLWRDDIRVLQELNADHYLCEISWTRLLPEPFKTTVNMRALEYYNNLFDGLIAKKIKIVVVLLKFDIPEILQRIGGVTNECFIDVFEVYADICFHYFGKRVTKWITFAEPNQLARELYGNPNLWPVIQPIPGVSDYIANRILLKSHAAVYHLYQKRYAKECGGSIGLSLYSRCYYANPLGGTEDDVDTALQFDLGIMAHPIFNGDYPEKVKYQIAKLSREQGYTTSRLCELSKSEINEIKGTADFFGWYYYSSRLVNKTDSPKGYAADHTFYTPDAGLEYDFDPSWDRGLLPYQAIVPEGFRKCLGWIKDNYKNPDIVVTGNGWADSGQLDDPERLTYFRDHSIALLQSIVEDRTRVCAYTAWSCIDGFEFAYGLSAHYGLYGIDFENDPTLERKRKLSAEYLSEVFRTNSIA